MLILTPSISTTPGTPPSYNNGIVETFSWIPVANNANRPLYARASYIVNAQEMSSFTFCETRTSGNPSFTSRQVLMHNASNSDVNVILTLTSGMSCSIPVGKSVTSNHIQTLNLCVSSVQDYAGCTLTFLA